MVCNQICRYLSRSQNNCVQPTLYIFIKSQNYGVQPSLHIFIKKLKSLCATKFIDIYKKVKIMVWNQVFRYL